MNPTETIAVALQVAQVLRNTRRDLKDAALDVKARLTKGAAPADAKDIAERNAAWMLVNLGKVEAVLSDSADRDQLDAYLKSFGGSVADWESEIADLKALVTDDAGKLRRDATEISKAADETIAATPQFRTLGKLY